jgi:hypothetical protein
MLILLLFCPHCTCLYFTYYASHGFEERGKVIAEPNLIGQISSTTMEGKLYLKGMCRKRKLKKEARAAKLGHYVESVEQKNAGLALFCFLIVRISIEGSSINRKSWFNL